MHRYPNVKLTRVRQRFNGVEQEIRYYLEDLSFFYMCQRTFLGCLVEYPLPRDNKFPDVKIPDWSWRER
jgi:hypothetical protein